MIESIPVSVLDIPLEGQHVAGRTLREELAAGPTLLVFLRHFG